MNPMCDVCGKEIRDWEGNIMVPWDEYLPTTEGEPASVRTIRMIKIMCKPCTIQIDRERIGEEWHNLWELSWVKDDTLRYLGIILSNLLSADLGFAWKPEAVRKVYKLALAAHPELAAGTTDLP